jgi:signal transduction histidine kinase/HAMP domain-containing protein
VRLTRQVLAGSLLIVAVLGALVIALASRRLERRLELSAVADLTREGRLVASMWTPAVNPDSLADAVGRQLERRVTLIDSTGRVIGDADFDPPALQGLQNHSMRPEVVAALRTGVGRSLRQSASAGDRELYVAVRAPLGVARVSMTTRALAAIVGGAPRDVASATLIAVLLALILTVQFARSVARPIIALRDVAARLATGDLSQRPQLSAAGEVGDLADALSRMAEQLEARLTALRAEDALTSAVLESLNEGVIAVDGSGTVVRVNQGARALLPLHELAPFAVTQLPRDRVLRDALETARRGEMAEPTEGIVAGRTMTVTARPLGDGGAVLTLLDTTVLRKLEAVRRDFVANVSHELRTPLTLVIGFAETLVEQHAPGSQEHQFADVIRANALRMQHIVDDLLDLSRIESGGWVPSPRDVAVVTIAREVRDVATGNAERRGVTITLDLPESLRVSADPTALRQVLANLVSNAVRHAPAGTVTVFGRVEPDGTTAIGVRDTGRGIAAEHLPRIFERFYRADPGRSRDEGGTGLGLAIVKHLVEAHGGQVRAESAPGHGTTVTALFPAAPQVA